MVPFQRAVVRPRLRRSWLAYGLVAFMVLIGLAAGMALAPAPAPAPRRADRTAPDHTARLREEIRQIALEACTARVELERITTLNECARGTASKMACSTGEGQYRFDPCGRYRPASEIDRCPFPGSCVR